MQSRAHPPVWRDSCLEPGRLGMFGDTVCRFALMTVMMMLMILIIAIIIIIKATMTMTTTSYPVFVVLLLQPATAATTAMRLGTVVSAKYSAVAPLLCGTFYYFNGYTMALRIITTSTSTTAAALAVVMIHQVTAQDATSSDKNFSPVIIRIGY